MKAAYFPIAKTRIFSRTGIGVIFFSFILQLTMLAVIPKPDKVVICILENHGYPQVIGSGAAPYINQLAGMGANMVEFYALTHPSQPNYIMLFSGENQGV
ncbi:MAG TPA: acid phosphatase, partial [Bacteroidia bacterium]|nr:acid phosphatase [Bacteroidia bacterium]